MTDVTLTPVDFNPFATSPAATPDPVSRADFPKISPDVQLEREKVRLAMLQDEQLNATNDDPATAGARQREIALTAKNIANGTPFGDSGGKAAPASRGTQIASELRASQGPKPLFPLNPDQPQVTLEPVNFDPFAAPAPDPGGVASKSLQALKGGVLDSFKELASTADAITTGKTDFAPSTKEFAKPLEWSDLLHPNTAVPKAVYQLSKGAPMLAGGMTGSVVGGAAGAAIPGVGETGLGEALGVIGGGAVGAGAISAVQALGPLYAAEIKKTPTDPDGAFERALSGAKQDGMWSAVGWGAFGLPIFKSTVKTMLVQAFAVQPAVSAAQQATQNVQEGRPATDNLSGTYLNSAVGTLLPAAGMHAAHAILGRGAPNEAGIAPGADAATMPNVAESTQPAAQQPLALPAPAHEPISVDKNGQAVTPSQLQDRAQTGLTPDIAAAQTAHPGFSTTDTPPPTVSLRPIEQARMDAQTLQRGESIDNLNPVRQANAQLVATYGENAAVRHVIESGELGSVGQAMLAVAPKVEQVRQTLQAGQKSRDITSDVMTAIDELARMRQDGKTVADVMAHGVSHEVSYEGQQLMHFLDANLNNPQKIASFMEHYLQTVQDMGGVPSDVRGKAFDIIAERKAAKREAEMADAFSQKEGKEAKQVKTETQRMTEQARGESALTEIAKARAAGHGINPEHQTAMEIAFANARQLKESKNAGKPLPASNESVRPEKTGANQSVGNESARVATPSQERVSGRVETGNAGNPRSVRENVNPSRPEGNLPAVNRGEQIKAERRENAAAPKTLQEEVVRPVKPAQDKALQGDVPPAPKDEKAVNLAKVEEAGKEAAHSPHNDKPLPTAAQHEAGNYQKGHANVLGLGVTIENPKGSVRTGVGPDGKPWQVKVTTPYGYIKRTIGGDKEHIDVYLGDHLTEGAPVFVIDQRDPTTGKFDEHKVVLGSKSYREAKDIYDEHFSDDSGESRRGAVTKMALPEFKDWLTGDTTKAVKYKEPAVPVDRRQDNSERKRIDDMTPDELRKALLTDALTGLPNRRAYEETAKQAIQVSADADSLKWINDNMGHDAGDKMLQAIGEAFQAETDQAYHISGDEFVVQAATPEEAAALMKSVQERLASAILKVELPSGEQITVNGIGISHGAGKTLGEAELGLQQNKQEREDAGLRGARGSEPPGALRSAGDRQGQQTTQRDVTSQSDALTAPEPKKKQPVPLTQESANRLARQFNEQGTPTEVIPHPTVPGKYTLFKRDVQPASGMEIADANSEVARLRKAWANGPSIDVVQSVRDLPFAAPDDAKGAYRDGKVWLVADGLSSPIELQQVLFHEVLGHIGLRGLFGEQLASQMRAIEEKNLNVSVRAMNWREKNKDIRGERTDEQWRAHSIEEALADMAGEGKRITGLDKFVASIQSGLRAIGLDGIANWMEKSTNAEAMRMLASAKQYIENGKNAPTFGRQAPVAFNRADSNPGNSDIMFSRANSLDKIKEYEAVKNTIANVSESYDGLRRAFSPQYRSPEALEVARQLTEHLGEKEMRDIQFKKKLNDAIVKTDESVTLGQKARDLMEKGLTVAADKTFLKMSAEENHAFMQAMDVGDAKYFEAHPELKGMADVIGKMFADKAAKIQSLDTGAMQTIRDNYFPHIWNREPTGDQMRQIYSGLSKRPLEGQKGFAKERIFDDVNAGLKAGFEPISHNPLDLVALKMAEMDKYIIAHQTLSGMEKSKTSAVRLITGSDKPLQGYSDVNGRYGFIDRDNQKLRYVARDDVAQVLNNYLSKSLYHDPYVGKPFTGYMKAANLLNQFQLGVFSAFHAGFTSMEAVISHAALGVKSLSEGNLSGAAKYFSTAPAAWLTNPRMGGKIMEEMLKPGSHPEMASIIQGLQMAGFRWQMDTRFKSDNTKEMLSAWQKGDKLNAGLHAMGAAVEQSARPILEWLVPRQKFGVFGEMMNKWMAENPNASHEDMRNSAQQIWNRVDSRLGQVVYDRLFMHNVTKNILQMLIRAPGWTGGTILEVGGGMKDLAQYAADAARGRKPPGLTDRAAYTLSMLTVTALANALLTAGFTGEPPDDWRDLVAFKTGNLDEYGRPERFMLPTYMKDVYAYSQAPLDTLVHKSHPLLSLGAELVKNKDFYGTEIRSEDSNILMQLAQSAGYAAKAFVPFWMRGVQKEQERGGSALSQVAPLIGVMPAPSSVNKTAAEKLMSEYAADRLPQGSRTAEQTEIANAQRALYVALRKGDTERAQELLQQGEEDHILTPKDYATASRKATQDPMMNSFKNLTYDQAKQVMKVANDDEQKKLKLMFLEKTMKNASKNASRGVTQDD